MTKQFTYIGVYEKKVYKPISKRMVESQQGGYSQSRTTSLGLYAGIPPTEKFFWRINCIYGTQQFFNSKKCYGYGTMASYN